MPRYEYKDLKTGEVVIKNVPIDERDDQEGYERIFSFSGMVSSTYGGLK